MSRIGKQPVVIPSGVKCGVSSSVVSVEGPKGKLTFTHARDVAVEVKDGKVLVSVLSEDMQAKANYGTTRATINNMVHGVSAGWKRSLELNGVGFNAKIQGTKLVIQVGHSHDDILEIPQGIKCNVNKTTVELESANRELLGTFAANIRKIHPPEPYLGKGIKYSDEVVRRKAGKTGKK